jgi:glycyl-tRNA synthetase beta chain
MNTTEQLTDDEKIAPKIWKVNISDIERAALLCKTDLTTKMVIEFPELQGIMGKYYAINDGEKEDVAIAIEQHYWPINAEDGIPTTDMGKILALSDKLDTLVGCFIMNFKCNASSDAFKMRRNAIAIIRIIIEGEINICLKELIEECIEIFKNNSNKEIKLNKEDITNKTLDFIKNKLINYYEEKKIKNDVVKAVLAIESNNLLDINNRIMALNKFSSSEKGKKIISTYKRVDKLLKSYKEPIEATSINPELFEHESEKILYKKIKEISDERK